MCGKLHCTSDSLQNLPAWTLFNNLTGVVCLTTDFDLGSDFPDPAQVHAGTACGEGKVRFVIVVIVEYITCNGKFSL